MPPKKEEGDPLAALGLQVPKLDEGKLLADCRSPRFFKACQKLQIDPLDLRPRELETFEEAGSSPAKTQVRFAMYERSRFAKWQTINETRFQLPRGDFKPIAGDKASARSKSAELFRTSLTKSSDLAKSQVSWVPASGLCADIKARTMVQQKNGRVEVVKITAKKLRDITSVGDFSEQEREEDKQKKIQAKLDAERRRKEMIKRDEEKERQRKERLKKQHQEQNEREQAQRELDKSLAEKLRKMRENWEQESAEKMRKQSEHHAQVQANLDAENRKKEEEIQKLLRGFERKEAQVQKLREEVFGAGPSGTAGQIAEQAAIAQRKREAIAKAVEARSKRLLAESLAKKAASEKKEQAMMEKKKETEKKNQESAKAAKERQAEIKRRKEAIIKERETKVIEHMEKVEENLKANKEKIQKELELKAEVARLQYEQAQENVWREKARVRQEQRELGELHETLDDIQRARVDALEKLKRERQLQATQIRLQKDHLQEEVFLIQVQNSWNRAHKMLNSWEREGVVPPVEAHGPHI